MQDPGEAVYLTKSLERYDRTKILEQIIMEMKGNGIDEIKKKGIKVKNKQLIDSCFTNLLILNHYFD